MHLYRIRDRWAVAHSQPAAFEPDWAGSLEQAKACMATIRRDDADVDRNSFLVELVDYPTDKNALLDHLTGASLPVLRRWISTPRGTLMEIQEETSC